MTQARPDFERVRIAGLGKSALWVAQRAQAMGVIANFQMQEDDLHAADLILIDDSPESTRSWLRNVSEQAKAGTLVMDFSSTKEPITDFADDMIPLTLHYLSVSIIDSGESVSPTSGAQPSVAFTPSMATRPEALERAQEFWERLGFSVFQWLAHEHDIMVAGLRDGPRLLAAAYLQTLHHLYPDLGELRRLDAPLMRQLRQMASSMDNPDASTENAQNVCTILEGVIRELRQLQSAIEAAPRDPSTLQQNHREVQSIGVHLGQDDAS